MKKKAAHSSYAIGIALTGKGHETLTVEQKNLEGRINDEKVIFEFIGGVIVIYIFRRQYGDKPCRQKNSVRRFLS
jgi:hypothetical protein